MKGSPTRNGPAEAGKSVGIDQRERDGMIVRAVLGITESLWRVVTGYLFDGSRVSRDAEVFSGVGFYARPPTSANAEAIVVSVGGDASSGMIVATRDEATRKASAGDAKPNETVAFNTLARVRITDAGKIEASTIGGAAVALPTMADLQALRQYIDDQFGAANGHIHVVVGGATTTIAASTGATATPPTVPVPTPVGTTTLKGE